MSAMPEGRRCPAFCLILLALVLLCVPAMADTYRVPVTTATLTCPSSTYPEPVEPYTIEVNPDVLRVGCGPGLGYTSIVILDSQDMPADTTGYYMRLHLRSLGSQPLYYAAYGPYEVGSGTPTVQNFDTALYSSGTTFWEQCRSDIPEAYGSKTWSPSWRYSQWVLDGGAFYGQPTVELDGRDVYLELVSVPEPNSFWLIAVPCIWLSLHVALRRKRPALVLGCLLAIALTVPAVADTYSVPFHSANISYRSHYYLEIVSGIATPDMYTIEYDPAVLRVGLDLTNEWSYDSVIIVDWEAFAGPPVSSLQSLVMYVEPEPNGLSSYGLNTDATTHAVPELTDFDAQPHGGLVFSYPCDASSTSVGLFVNPFFRYNRWNFTTYNEGIVELKNPILIATEIPEPSSLAALAAAFTGLVGVVGRRRRQL